MDAVNLSGWRGLDARGRAGWRPRECGPEAIESRHAADSWDSPWVSVMNPAGGLCPAASRGIAALPVGEHARSGAGDAAKGGMPFSQWPPADRWIVKLIVSKKDNILMIRRSARAASINLKTALKNHELHECSRIEGARKTPGFTRVVSGCFAPIH